jgi:micrococcal nuclease
MNGAALRYLWILAAALAWLPGAEGGELVYVTSSGKKYHRETCSSLRRSKIALSLEEAVRSGYTPCSVCRPPALNSPSPLEPPAQGLAFPGPAAAPGAALYRVNAEGLVRSSAGEISRMLPALVVDHVDGDTVRVRISGDAGSLETIRLLGVDTPETVHPSRPVERFGREASDFTKARLLGRAVYLAFDWDLRDRYGRLLAYVYTREGRCFNALLVEEGYGQAYLRFPFQFIEEFKALEQEARRAGRGLWGEGP